MKKQRKYNLFMSVCLWLAASALAVAAPAKEFSRTISEEFDITSTGLVEVMNKYGNVDLQTWSDNRVKIEVTIVVEARNQEKADETFDRIEIDFNNSASRVSAETVISTVKSWKRWFGNNSGKFEINYQVYLPASVEVNIDNKYGDVYVPGMSNRAEVSVKYGNLRMDDVAGEVDITLGYAKGAIASAQDADLDLKYSNLRCGSLGDVVLNTKYSSFEAESMGNVRSTSSYDNYDIRSLESINNIGKYDDMILGTVGEVDFDTKYTNIEIDELTGSADFVTKYGGVKVDGLAAGFTHVDISSSYTDVILLVDQSASFTVEAYCKHCSIKESGIEVTHETDKNSEHELKGYRGSRDASSRITADLSYGNLTIR